jgi:hypothetical protein
LIAFKCVKAGEAAMRFTWYDFPVPTLRREGQGSESDRAHASYKHTICLKVSAALYRSRREEYGDPVDDDVR